MDGLHSKQSVEIFLCGRRKQRQVKKSQISFGIYLVLEHYLNISDFYYLFGTEFSSGNQAPSW